MIPLTLNAPRIPLDHWGTPEDIGATTVEGPIKVSGKLVFGTFETPISGGFYAATKGKYRVTYPFTEHATLLDGELAITDEATGETTTYGPGDSWIIAKGTTVLWHIRSAHICKSYLAAV
jgi:uncharacterized cupin superfamily protein